MKDKLLTRGGALLMSSVVMNTIPVGFMNVVPLVYLAEIGYDPSVIGTIYAVSALTNAVGLIPMGVLADRYGRKWLLVIGSALPAASYAIFGSTLDPWWLVVASGIGGIGFAGGFAYALVNTTVIPLLAQSTSDRNRTTLFGLSQGVFTSGLSFGALLSVVPSLLVSMGESSTIAHSNAYFLMSAIIVASVVPLFFFVEKRSGGGLSDAVETSGSKLRSRMRLRVSSVSIVSKLSVVYALAGLGLGALIQLLPTWYALRFGVSEDTVGAWIAVANASSIIIIPIIPVLVRKRGTLVSTVGTAVVAAALLALIPVAGSFESAAGLFVVRTVFAEMSFAMLLSYTMGVIPELERATVTGITFTAWGVGATLGTYAGGLFLGAGLLTYPFILGVAAYLVAALVLPVFFRNVPLPEELPAVGLPREITRSMDL